MGAVRIHAMSIESFDSFVGFPPQFASAVVVPVEDTLSENIAQGNMSKKARLPTLDYVSKESVNATNRSTRHFIVAARGIVSAFVPVLTKKNKLAGKAGKAHYQNLRRLSQTSKTVMHDDADYAWFQVQVNCDRNLSTMSPNYTS